MHDALSSAVLLYSESCAPVIPHAEVVRSIAHLLCYDVEMTIDSLGIPANDTQEISDGESKVSKDETFWRILDSALRLECSKGHLRWKMTDLSRASGVTRSLIYYYFGNSKVNIVTEAIRILGEEFFGLSDERMKLWREGKIAESMIKSRELTQHAPYIVLFYLQQRQAGGALYEEIQKLEKRYMEKLAERFPRSTEEGRIATFSALLGITALADLSGETAQKIVQLLISALA